MITPKEPSRELSLKQAVRMTKARVIEIARGTVEAAKAIADECHPDNQERANCWAVQLGGWKGLAQDFPVFFGQIDNLVADNPDYNLDTFIGVTAICRSRGYEINLEGVEV